jgi:hypothetical protein
LTPTLSSPPMRNTGERLPKNAVTATYRSYSSKPPGWQMRKAQPHINARPYLRTPHMPGLRQIDRSRVLRKTVDSCVSIVYDIGRVQKNLEEHQPKGMSFRMSHKLPPSLTQRSFLPSLHPPQQPLQLPVTPKIVPVKQKRLPRTQRTSSLGEQYILHTLPSYVQYITYLIQLRKTSLCSSSHINTDITSSLQFHNIISHHIPLTQTSTLPTSNT